MNLATKGKTIRSREDGLQEKIARFRKQEEEVRSLDLAFRDYVAALDTVSKAESRLMAAWAGNIQDTGVSPSYAFLSQNHKSRQKIPLWSKSGPQFWLDLNILYPFCSLFGQCQFFLQHYIFSATLHFIYRTCRDASDPGLGEP